MFLAQKHTSLGFFLFGAGHLCGSSRGGASAEPLNKQDPWACAWKAENEKAHVAQPVCVYFHKGTENCSFEMAAPYTPPTQRPMLLKKTLCLCRDIPVAPLPLACTFLMAASLFPISVVKQHQLGETMSCRKIRYFHISWDSSSFQWQRELATWLHMERNEKWIQFGPEKTWSEER